MPSQRSFEIPRDRHYDGANHLWVQHDQASGRVRVGVDTIGLDALGELAYIGIEACGASVAAGGTVGSLEAAKMTTTIVSPVAGMVVTRNEAVLEDPQLVNRDPYGDGWLVEIEPGDWARAAASLIEGEAIGPWVQRELERLAAEDNQAQ